MNTSTFFRMSICLSVLFVVATAQAQQKVVVIPIDGGEPIDLVPGNTELVAKRDGFSAQCTKWSGSVCQAAWVGMDSNSVLEPDPHCIDRPASLRPLWWDSDVEAQAALFCWIATGNPDFISAIDSGDASQQSGWNYLSTEEASIDNCQAPGGFRRHSRIAIPGIGEQIWSFDNFSESRTGRFSQYRCIWPSVGK